MKLLKRLGVLLAAASLFAWVSLAQEGPIRLSDTAHELAKNSYIFVFEETVSAAEVPGLARALAENHGAQLTHIYRNALRGFAAQVPEQEAARIGAQPFIRYYEKDGVAYALEKKAKPPWAGGGGGSNPQQTPWGVTRVGGPQPGAGKTAWVIDTGIDLDHPDLSVDVSRSANFVTRGKNSPDDGNGHGTHVAGTIAAIDNDIDVVGVAAGATLVAVRVLDNSGSGTVSGVVAGVDYVAANAAAGDVANMSLGAKGHFSSLHDAVANAAAKGIKFSIAAGNDGDHASNYEPAHVEHGNVFTISAIADSDCMPSWSNFGNPPVDYAAPGVSILSTARGGGTTTMSGTSMAAPHVAGILLLAPVGQNGTACNDPDGNPDPIAHF